MLDLVKDRLSLRGEASPLELTTIHGKSVRIPGDRLLQRSVLWGTQNLADLTQTAKNLKVRWTQQGKAPEAPVSGTVKVGP